MDAAVGDPADGLCLVGQQIDVGLDGCCPLAVAHGADVEFLGQIRHLGGDLRVGLGILHQQQRAHIVIQRLADGLGCILHGVDLGVDARRRCRLEHRPQDTVAGGEIVHYNDALDIIMMDDDRHALAVDQPVVTTNKYDHFTYPLLKDY